MLGVAVMGLATTNGQRRRLPTTSGAFLLSIAGYRLLSNPAHQFQYQQPDNPGGERDNRIHQPVKLPVYADIRVFQIRLELRLPL